MDFGPAVMLPDYAPINHATPSPRNQCTWLHGLLLIYRPLRDGWLSWLTYSGRLTHKVIIRPASSQAQDRESSPVKDQRSTTVLRRQLKLCLGREHPRMGNVGTAFTTWLQCGTTVTFWWWHCLVENCENPSKVKLGDEHNTVQSRSSFWWLNVVVVFCGYIVFSFHCYCRYEVP